MSLIPTPGRLTGTDGASALRIVVRDDGIGIGDDVPAGIGLVSQRERAAELSGTWEVTCAPGNGTLLRAVLPIR
jgi:signal transduction histidine kinase